MPDGITQDTATSSIQSVSNLYVAVNATNPTFQVDVSADALVLLTTANVAKVYRTVSLTGIDITVAGANGLDTGSRAASTTYYVWVIGQSGGTAAGLLSLSATAPTMPSGYIYKRLVSVLRVDGSSNFLAYIQQNDTLSFESVSAQQLLSAVPATTVTVVSCASYLPAAICRQALLHVRWNWSGNSSHFMRADTTQTGWAAGTAWGAAPGPQSTAEVVITNGSNALIDYAPAIIGLDSSAQFKYVAQTAANTMSLWLAGGRLRL